MRPLDVENSNDLNRYYRQAYLAVPREGEQINDIFQFEAADEHQVVGTIYRGLTDPKWSKIIYNYKEFVQKVEFGRPDVGMTRYGLNLAYASYCSIRESNRGLRLNRINKSLFNDWETRSYNPTVSSTDLLWSLFNPTYCSDILKAYQELMDGTKAGIPLTKDLGAVITSSHSEPCLVYRDSFAGFLDKSGTVYLAPPFEGYVDLFYSQLNCRVTCI